MPITFAYRDAASFAIHAPLEHDGMPFRLPRPLRFLLHCLFLLVGAYASIPPAPEQPDRERHRAAVTALDTWSLGGRLNVRQPNQSGGTAVINWSQQGQSFDLRLSSTVLGLGAMRVHGTPVLVTVEKAGEDSVILPGLEALTREYFGYDFPTAQLLYWVRGIPAPDLPAITTLDANQHLGSLSQDDPEGRRWQLDYDRYQPRDDLWLPGRIRGQHDDLLLTFLINNWRITPAADPVATEPVR